MTTAGRAVVFSGSTVAIGLLGPERAERCCGVGRGNARLATRLRSEAIWGIPAAGLIPSWLPLIVFAFLFGLSMDYEVFILARTREEYDAIGRTDAAVVHGIGRTGRHVTSAALIMFLSFVAMASAPSTQVKMIATGLGAGIILDVTIPSARG